MNHLEQVIIKRGDYGLCPITGREIKTNEPVELVKFYVVDHCDIVEHFIRVPTKWIHRRESCQT